ncbi:MAG: EamA family transporter [Myxococcota bacterium]|nr:EamA family transporter [Myxococcota bacterium]
MNASPRLQKPHPATPWLLLSGLALMWGSAFLFTQVALEGVSPGPLVALRVAIAALTLNLLRRALGLHLPRDARTWLRLLPLSLTGTVVPFLLISWGQQAVPSGLAGVLMAVTPLATIVLAHFAVRGEELDERKLLGVLLGFAGVVALLGPEKLGRLGDATALLPPLAILAGAVCYAANTVLARRLPPLHPLVYGSMVMVWATALAAPLGSAGSASSLLAAGAPALLATAWLGILPTGLATLAHYRLVVCAGAGFASLTAYVIPIVALAAGAAVLGERIQPSALGALALILLGVALSRTSPASEAPARTRLEYTPGGKSPAADGGAA